MYYYKQVQDGITTSVESKSKPALSPTFAKATKAEYDTFIASLPVIEPQPTPDEARLAEIVATSPAVITMPDIWEAIRILARMQGIGE